MIAVQINQEESKHAIAEFNNNIFEKQVSNVIFKDDSFIKFVKQDICIIHLNPVIKVKEFILALGLILSVVYFIFFSKIYALVTALATIVIFFTFETIYYILFKKGLKKAGYTGKIKLL